MLVIQPDLSDPVGPLGEWLAEEGAALDVRNPPNDELPGGLGDYQGLVCLGGGMSAGDDAAHPWLASVRRLLASATSDRLPTVGICLGAQLLAVAAGGRVAPAEPGPEAGPGLVSKRDAAWQDPLLAELPLMPDVLQFHRDWIEQLPPGAQLLAAAPGYPNQAFRVGSCAYGLQFHIETTPQVVLSWADSAPDLAASARAGALDRDALIQLHDDLREVWRPFAHRFVRLAGGLLEPAAPRGSTLPLA